MTSSENNNWSTPILIITILTVGLCILYFTSNYFSKQVPPQERQDFDYSGRFAQPAKTPDRIVLSKNEKLVTGRNSLVFKGIDKNVVIIDLYLLDMDKEQAYEKRFTKKEAKRGFSLGGGNYRLVSVNDRYLTLKIITKPSTP